MDDFGFPCEDDHLGRSSAITRLAIDWMERGRHTFKWREDDYLKGQLDVLIALYGPMYPSGTKPHDNDYARDGYMIPLRRRLYDLQNPDAPREYMPAKKKSN